MNTIQYSATDLTSSSCLTSLGSLHSPRLVPGTTSGSEPEERGWGRPLLPQPRGRSRSGWRVETRPGAPPKRSAESTVFLQDLQSWTPSADGKEPAQLPEQRRPLAPPGWARTAGECPSLLPTHPGVQQVGGQEAAPSRTTPPGSPGRAAGSSLHPGLVPITLGTPAPPSWSRLRCARGPELPLGSALLRGLAATEMANPGARLELAMVTP